MLKLNKKQKVILIELLEGAINKLDITIDIDMAYYFKNIEAYNELELEAMELRLEELKQLKEALAND
jgi:hypothetical protein